MERIVGVGLDVVDTSQRTIDEDVVRRVLSARERARYDALVDPKARADFFFGRWAAKEAVFKATGQKLAFSAITIVNEPDGKPSVSGVEGVEILLSISHDCAVFAAVAIAIALK